ncbi:metal ABC transporter solute-binding protein, Zn/Mn family [Bifidobacterium scaligerum]|uniref:ABC transporter substrate-binding protein n=1 Tax=Bifidobacterium scaligerum TaxID=2052656 RepID=A0A2M9HPT6_9BIFI|nr:zinc ABC transporter substrate-binding protein [Bifidobacterium scaligerum]PJM78832.1 ABC transporter substrate-binding protein [Bifidobacterium scaligerum]
MTAWKKITAIMASAVLVAGLAGCGSNGASNGANDGKLEVVASINQWGSVAQDLGGEYVAVTNIMSKTNVEAHDYEPTSRDIAKFTSAKVSIVNGADYDSWAVKAAQSTNANLVNAAESAGIEDGSNPHVWFSSKVRVAAADAITAAYQKADPDHSDEYAELNKAWHSKEDQLEAKIQEVAGTVKGLKYAATESVAWYLADDLTMDDSTPQGYAQAVANESEPTPSDIKDFQDELKQDGITMLIFNSQEASAATDQITSAAKDAGVPIVDLTEQMPSEYSNLLDWMGALVDGFAAAAK